MSLKVRFYVIGIIAAIAALSIATILIGRYKILTGGKDTADEVNEYNKHYVLIAGDMSSPFWQTVYDSAKAEAEADHIYLEAMGNNLSDEYNLEDYLRISIASKVDGIIVYPDGSESAAALIGEAEDAKIPVITIMNDTLNTDRVSFVGVNLYQLGTIYAQQILNQVNADTRNVYVLFHHTGISSMNDVLFNQIKKTLNEALSGRNVNIQPYYISNENEFDTEEAVRDIFISSDTVPDILVCLEEIDTECAIQASIDYNMVGMVKIIGTDSSDFVLQAIKKKLAALTVSIDTKQLGKQSVQALYEYQQSGYVNNYYNVDLHVINTDNVDSYIAK